MCRGCLVLAGVPGRLVRGTCARSAVLPDQEERNRREDHRHRQQASEEHGQKRQVDEALGHDEPSLYEVLG